jgi:hypothetical protein
MCCRTSTAGGRQRTFRCAAISPTQLSTASGPQYLQRGSLIRFQLRGGMWAGECSVGHEALGGGEEGFAGMPGPASQR